MKQKILNQKKLGFVMLGALAIALLMLVVSVATNIAKAEPVNEAYAKDINLTLTKTPKLGESTEGITIKTDTIKPAHKIDSVQFLNEEFKQVTQFEKVGNYYMCVRAELDDTNSYFDYEEDSSSGLRVYKYKHDCFLEDNTKYTCIRKTCGIPNDIGGVTTGDPAYAISMIFSFEILEVPKHTVSGRIVDKDGDPQSGAYVDAYPVDGEGQCEDWAQTDNDGNYSLELTEGKNYILDCYAGDSMYSDITTGVLTNDKVMDDIYIYQELSEEGLKATLSDYDNCKLKICAVKPFTDEVIVTEDGPLERYINSGEEEVLEELINVQSVFKYNISGNKIILQNDYIQNFYYFDLVEAGPLDIEIVAEPNDGYEVSSWDVIPADYVSNSFNSQSGYVTQDLTFKANIQPIPPQSTTDPESYNVAQTGDMTFAIVAGLCIIAVAAGTTLLIRKRKLNK